MKTIEVPTIPRLRTMMTASRARARQRSALLQYGRASEPASRRTRSRRRPPAAVPSSSPREGNAGLRRAPKIGRVERAGLTTEFELDAVRIEEEDRFGMAEVDDRRHLDPVALQVPAAGLGVGGRSRPGGGGGPSAGPGGRV